MASTNSTQDTAIKPAFPAALLALDRKGNRSLPLNPPAPFAGYVLEELVSCSHMSLVVRATGRDAAGLIGKLLGRTGRSVAIKFFRFSSVSPEDTPAALRRFDAEVEALQTIRSASAVKVLGHGEFRTDDGKFFPYYVMEWVDGPLLDEVLGDPDVSVEEKARFIEAVAHVVAMLHAKGGAHRDLKGANVKVRDGRPVILDPGSAFFEDARETEDELTRTGCPVPYTPGYVPAWHLDNPRLVLDSVPATALLYRQKWDVYSLSVLLIFALTGVRPKPDRESRRDPRFSPEAAEGLLARFLPGDERFGRLVRSGLSLNPDECPTAEDFYRAVSRALARDTATPPTEVPTAPQAAGPGALHLRISPPGATAVLTNIHGIRVLEPAVVPESGVVIFQRPDPAAAYQVLVHLIDYQPYRHRVQPITPELRIELERLRCEVAFHTTPGALITVRNDFGEEHRFGPVEPSGVLQMNSLTEGDWTYEIMLEDHQRATGELRDLEHGRPRPVDRPLRPLPSSLTVAGHKRLEIWHGGRRLGTAGVPIPLDAGEYQLFLLREGLRRRVLPVEMLAGTAVYLTEDDAREDPDPWVATRNAPWLNDLGLPFVPVPETEVLFCQWPVRVRDYQACAEAKSGVDGNWWSPGFNQSPDHPVVNVNWKDAVAFCQWLTARDRVSGLLGPDEEYRLPADWEWSFAVGLKESRTGTPQEKDGKITGAHPWGSGWPPPKGAGNYAQSLNVDDFEQTAPVGSFKPNQYGLFDLGGNVWEWCEDFCDGKSGARVLRGASWGNDARVNLLSSCRLRIDPGGRDNYCGFRVVLARVSSR